MMLLKKILFWLIMSLSYFSLSTAHANLTLNLSKTGSGQGQVSGYYENYDYSTSGSGISVSCGAATCPYSIEPGSQVYLYAYSQADSAFEKWMGDVCNNSTSTSCYFEMNQNPTNLTASFRQLAANRVKISKGGEGLGGMRVLSPTSIQEADFSSATRIKELSNPNTQVKVRAKALTGYKFSHWQGCDETIVIVNELTVDCKVQVTGVKDIKAFFNRPDYKLTVEKHINNTGFGTVTNYDYTSSGSGVGVINCAPGCNSAEAYYPAGEIAQLQAQAADGSKFDGWVNCPNSSSTLLSSTCETTPILADRDVTAKFKLLSNRRLELSRTGTGTGGITNVVPATPAISCYGGTCIAEYSANTTVTLQANPTNGSVFDGWVGCNPIANSQPPRCTVSVNNSVPSASNNFKKVIAKFKSVKYGLTVTPAGAGIIQDFYYDYTSSGSGIIINCGNGSTACGAELNSGTSITLSAQPNNGAQFIGWGGDGTCTGTEDTCYVLMNSTKHINANFTPAP